MIALIQRVSEAAVEVEGECIGHIGAGLLALIGVEREDGPPHCGRLLEKILNYRVFPDEAGRMNRSLRDTDGGLLLVPQFTLAADTRHGTRPGFSDAAAPGQARQLYEQLLSEARSLHGKVASGRFGADMRVSLCNEGPVTFWLECR